MEQIKIENFAGIKSMEFDFKSINILIGPQGSGKSITVKLLFFFKHFITDITSLIYSGGDKKEFDNRQKTIFTNYFPKESWPKGDFLISYILDTSTIYVKKNNNKLTIGYSENIKKAISKAISIYAERKTNTDKNTSMASLFLNPTKEIEDYIGNQISTVATYEQFFIPAGRSFFANIQKNIFSFLNDNRSLDPFLIKFGSSYENLKRFYVNEINNKQDKDFNEIASQILNSNYLREKDKDFLIHSDSRKVNLSNASSGQQETLPLIVILKALNEFNYLKDGATLYIEEPEAHLYPTAQKRIVQLLVRTFSNKKSNFQIIVTTHSPYILSSFNNLLQAGRLAVLKPNRFEDIEKIIPKEEQIAPGLFCAYSLNNGEKKILIDEETQLISQTTLDSVSNEIADEFGNLLDIEF
jgi:predicted ATP-dependent endonuclease of OLD family